MALFEDFGQAENDTGKWIEWVKDPETKKQVELQIRAIPFDKSMQLERKHGREEFASDAMGRKRHQRVRTDEETIAWMWDRAEWAWVNARNFEIRPRDAESADFYTRHLKAVTPIAIGDVVTLDGVLNTAVKRRLFSKSLALARFIGEQSEKLREAAEHEENELLKTS